jgi:FxsC-like protein
MLPVSWLPTTMHEVAAALQYTTDEFSEAYRRHGFRQLLRLQRNRDDYLEAVSTLADHIVRVASEHPPDRYRPAAAFESIPSAFHASPPAGSAEVVTPREANGRMLPSAQFVHFILATASREVAATVRQNTDFYGADCLEWAPYRPALSEPLASFARTVAAERSFASGVACDEELTERLDWAQQRNQVVVLLVDVWVAQLDAHRARLIECSERTSRSDVPPVAVLVPSSANDSETRAQWRRFTESVRSIFVSRVASGDEITLRTSVLTHDSFRADLTVVLEIARNRIFVTGSVQRLPRGEATGDRPLLQGP